MPRNWESKEATPISSRVVSKIHASSESRRLRYSGRVTTKSRSRRSSSRSRRSRSPRQKKSLSPISKRHGTTPEKRLPVRRSRSDSRPSQKRSRLSPRNRDKTPPPRHISRDRPHSYPAGKEVSSDKPRNSQGSGKRDDLTERFHDDTKYVMERPLFRVPSKDILHDRDNLKKIVVNMRDIPPAGDPIKRSMVSSDTMSRRAVATRGSRDYREMENTRMTARQVSYNPSPPLWNQRSCNYTRTVNHQEPSRYPSQGSRIVYERDDINDKRKFEENERERRRVVISSTIHSDRRDIGNSSDGIRNRDSYYDDRNNRNRDYSDVRSTPREYDSRMYEKSRDDRSREELRFVMANTRPRSRSYDRNRDTPVRKDRYEGPRVYQRTVERLPESNRVVRRLSSPSDSRRHLDDYRTVSDRRERSFEKRDVEQYHYRDHEFTPGDRYSTSDYHSKSQEYYEGEFRDSRMSSPSRGRGRTMPYRGRGMSSSRTFVRSPDAPVGEAASPRPSRTSYYPREASGRRLSFPPRKTFRGTFDSRH